MATYGRNFDFRVPPLHGQRGGRYAVSPTALTGAGSSGGGAAGTGRIPIGAPVVADLSAGLDSAGRQFVKLASQGGGSSFDNLSNSAALNGMAGIAVFEYGPAAYAGFDQMLTTFSDLDTVPLGAAVQVVSGTTVKVVLRNTVAHQFLGVRSYTGRTMVNGLGATATVAVGDYLVPGAGDDVDGYWQSTATEEGAWLVITSIDTNRLEVEAKMLF
jgi:hypothetical protein